MTARRVAMGSVVLTLAVAGWALVVLQTEGMSRGPTTDLGGLGPYVVMWVGMTGAMMLPSAAPTVLLVDRLSPRATPAFLAGYLLAWTAVGLAAFALVRLAVGTGATGWRATGPLLVLAGAYQLSPLKHACLRRCRAPLGFLRAHAGRSPLATGVAHGAYCVGCCAGLMLVLFALGVMSIFWMAVLAVVIVVEKVAPRGDRLAGPLASVLIVSGIVLAVA